MTTANEIATAPKDGTLIFVWRDGVEPQLMAWDKDHRAWLGKSPTPMGLVRTIWDKKAAQPTHWRAA